MKKKHEGLLTIKDLKQIVRKLDKQNKKHGKLEGFIGGFPIYSNTKVPEGEIWIRSGKSVKKFFITDLKK